MNTKLNELYKEVILQHNKSPYHFEQQPEATHVIEANNPLCGDRFNLYLMVKDDIIQSAYFHGFGCAISKASTSILTQQLEGKNISEINKFSSFFLDYINGKNRDAPTNESFEAFTAVDDFPARKTCATLMWDTINKQF